MLDEIIFKMNFMLQRVHNSCTLRRITTIQEENNHIKQFWGSYLINLYFLTLLHNKQREI